jgi:hypothetical protein
MSEKPPSPKPDRLYQVAAWVAIISGSLRILVLTSRASA